MGEAVAMLLKKVVLLLTTKTFLEVKSENMSPWRQNKIQISKL